MASRKPTKTSTRSRRAAPLRKSPAVKQAAVALEDQPHAPQKPEQAPIDASMLELINRSDETERLVHELAKRLLPITRKSDQEPGALGSLATDIPLVDAINARADHIGTINLQLLDLLDRLAT